MPDGTPTPRGRVRRVLSRVVRGDRVRGRHVVLSSLILGLLVGSPFAVAAGTGDPLIGGQRNPGNNLSSSLTRETQIIGNIGQGKGGIAANTGGFVTRQSNKSDSGGGAIYGCRAKAGTEACVAANNLNNGDAFRFQAAAGAPEIGLLRFGTDMKQLVDKPPFATNATGTVANLSADKLDGKDSTDFETTADAAKTFVPQSSLLYAVVNGSTNAATGREAGTVTHTSDVATNTTTYTVPFGDAKTDVSGCAYAATVRASGTATPPPLIAAAGSSSAKNAVTVVEYGSAAPPTADFSLTVTC